MPTYYVRSGATGANDGSSMADAWTNVDSTYAVTVAGDTVLFASDHVNATSSGTKTVAGALCASPVRWISVNKDTLAYERGAKLVGNATALVGNIDGFGLDFDAIGTSCTLSASNHGTFQRWTDCKFISSISSASANLSLGVGFTEFVNCEIGPYTGNTSGLCSGIANTRAYNTKFIGSSSSRLFLETGTYRVMLIAFGCDFSTYTSGLVTALSSTGRRFDLTMIGCKLSDAVSDAVIWRGGSRSATQVSCSTLLAEGCGGNLSNMTPGHLAYRHDGFGIQRPVTAVYRTGGASDGNAPYSFSFDSDTAGRAFAGRVVVRRLMYAGSYTVRLHVAHNGIGGGAGGSLLNSEFWVMAAAPSGATPATAQMQWLDNGLANPFATPARVGADETTNDWIGTGTSYAEYIEVPVTTTVDGVLELEVAHALGAGKTVYVDPAVDVVAV